MTDIERAVLEERLRSLHDMREFFREMANTFLNGFQTTEDYISELEERKKAPAPEGTEAPIVVDSQLELPGIR